MGIALKESIIQTIDQKTVQDLYACYATRLLSYTLKRYRINEDDARDLVYKTIFRMAEVHERYQFETLNHKHAFVFKTHVNFLRNYFRDNKQFEIRNREVELKDQAGEPEAEKLHSNYKLKLLQSLLDKLEDWQRILLLLRGQGMSYAEIAGFINKPQNQLKVYYARLKKQIQQDMNYHLNNKITNEKT